MQAFVFHLSDGRAPVNNFHLETFETVEEAIRHAERLIAPESRYQSVAVATGETVILELNKGE